MTKGYQLKHADSTNIIISRDVYIDEANLPGVDPVPTGPPNEVMTWTDDDHDDNNSLTTSTNELNQSDEEEAESEHDESDADVNDHDSLYNFENEVTQPTPCRSSCIMNCNAPNTVDQPILRCST